MKDVSYPCEVRRILLRFEDGEWAVESEQRVPEMTLPAPVRVPEGQDDVPVVGFWWEAIDAGGRVLYRDIAEDPELGMELFDADGSIRRVEHVGHGGTLEVLVPAMKELAGLRFVRSRPLKEGEDPARHRPEESVVTLGDRDAGGEHGHG